MSKSGNLEVEVKFVIDELPAFRARLLATGAKRTKRRLHERNVRFDDDEGSLLRKGQLLRLRQDDEARLTFKGMADADQGSEAKVREELETTVGSFDIIAEILEHLGFEAQQVYEKYRETFALDDVEVVLDELPYGNFVELEGSEEGIRAAAGKLDLPWEQRILDNYLYLMARMKKRYGLDFDDLTFENFAGRDLSVAVMLRKQ
ncbi:MAG TPA: class IV adenylate cyclase [Candidatus Binatia bacterium]|nr:class IV adenylate cyclase [Candidatus Binatia bacterium]